MFFLSALGGMVIAVGAAPGGAIGVAGALLGCMSARSLMRGAGPRPFGRGLVWFTAIAWCLMVAPAAHRTSEVASSLAAQAVQGPLLLSSDPWRAVPGWVALFVGLTASGWWCRHQQWPGADPAERWMRSAEAALCGAGVSQSVWGPSALALVEGPLTGSDIAAGALGLAVGIAAVAVVALARDRLPKERPLYMWTVLGLAVAALGVSLVGAWA